MIRLMDTVVLLVDTGDFPAFRSMMERLDARFMLMATSVKEMIVTVAKDRADFVEASWVALGRVFKRGGKP